MRKYYLLSIIFIASFIFSFYLDTSAQSVDDLRDKIDETSAQIEKINKEIKKLSNQITVTAEQKNTLANAIKELTLKRDKLVKERQVTEQKIGATGLIIKSLDNEIATKSSILNKSRETLKILLRDLNQQDSYTIVEKLLSKNNFVDFSREYNDVISVNSNIEDHIKNIILQKENLSVSKSQKELEKEALNTLKKSLTEKEKEILNNKKEKDQLLTATKNQESEYQKMLAEQLKRKEDFEKAIEEYEAQIKFILNPKLLPKEGSGVLSWPLNYILITSPYGNRCVKLNGYNSCKFHYGIDFRASVGTSVFAMADGVVMGTGDTDTACRGASFGKWVFIKYNNGLSSTYGHLSEIKVKSGQKIKRGDEVALSGNTGSSTGPHLHVSVYASTGVKVDTVPSVSCSGKIFTQPISALNAYLNPGSYLPPILSSMYK